jgi:hypothetical protein
VIHLLDGVIGHERTNGGRPKPGGPSPSAMTERPLADV